MLEPKIFDNADYESRLACNHELMALVASEFIKEAEGLLVELSRHIQYQDWVNFALVAHRLKGAALEVSGYRFCQLISKMERHALQSDHQSLGEDHHHLKSEFIVLVKALKLDILS
ncbi:Hpt domain-containing protein [Marinomonas pontica]|uniref:Hpt domain-containing protein n=1 Tax=Marinomonas pontica TaxID=264739 RepID=UPI002244E1E4|nr:Hpt domain-containing protein [Marinomonas pontica]MCW8355681.1 Hpt domain-containing protein [Marinomonas pontica]